MLSVGGNQQSAVAAQIREREDLYYVDLNKGNFRNGCPLETFKSREIRLKTEGEARLRQS